MDSLLTLLYELISSLSMGGGDAMEVKDALTIMFMFGAFILALLTYIDSNNKKK